MKFLIKIVLIITCWANCNLIYGQEENRSLYPIATHHTQNATIHGISFGLWSVSKVPKNVNTNGIKLELPGSGLLVPLVPMSPVAQTKEEFDKRDTVPVAEKINGMSISLLGSTCDCNVNGLALGGIGQILREVNGFSVVLEMNFTQVHRGVQVALLINETYQLRGVQFAATNYGKDVKGVQVGIFNKSKDLRGIQIGLWNKNGKRSLPIINWQFKKA